MMGYAVQNLVLIMTEDDEQMTPSLAALIKADFHVMTASSCDEALSLLSCARGVYRTLVIDADLAADPGGQDFVTRARAIVPDLPTIVLTETSAAVPPSDGLLRDIVLAKPVAPAELVMSVSRLLDLQPRDIQRPAAAPREQEPISGTIGFTGGSMPCVVRDVSISGISIELAIRTDLPDQVTLEIESAELNEPCRVLWRSDRNFSLAFGE
jgi:DNA-binding response OmpR family regulator